MIILWNVLACIGAATVAYLGTRFVLSLPDLIKFRIKVVKKDKEE